MYKKNRIIAKKKQLFTKRNSFEKIINILTKFSQIILTVIAVFGYFYTIRPLYQNQRLSEENAKISLDFENSLKTYNDLNSINILLEQEGESIKTINKELITENITLSNNNTKLEKTFSLYSKEVADLMNSKTILINENQRYLKSLEYKAFFTILSNSTKSRGGIFAKEASDYMFKDIITTVRKNNDIVTGEITEYSSNSENIYSKLVNINENINIDPFLNEIFKQPVDEVLRVLLEISTQKLDLPFIREDEIIKLCTNAIDYINKEKDSYMIRTNMLSGIKILLSDYIREKNNLNAKILYYESNTDYNSEYMLYTTELYGLRTSIVRDFTTHSLNIIDTYTIINDLKIELIDEDIEIISF